MDRSESTAEVQARSRRVWAEQVRAFHKIVAKEKGAVCRVFVALQGHADLDGYCWPLVSTIERETRLSRNTVFAAVKRLEGLGILSRRQLVSRGSQGRNSPVLFRIGGPIKNLPEKASRLYVLQVQPQQKSAVKSQVQPRRCTKNRYVGGDVPKTGTGAVAETGTGEIPKTGTGLIPEIGTQNYSKEVSEGISTSENKPTPNPACSVGSRQDHGAAIEHGVKNQGDGNTGAFSIARTIGFPLHHQAESDGRLPPVVAYYKKHRKLPPYIPDETHLVFDGDGRFCGYVDQDGKRRNEWNNFESIRMAEIRECNETIRKLPARSEPNEPARAEGHESEYDPRSLTPDEKRRMLRAGTIHEDVAERWSARSGIPAYIFLVTDSYERAEKFKEWKAARNRS
jgi:hypothetical protein